MNNLKSILLLPVGNLQEFEHLPNGVFYLKNVILRDGTIVEPICLKARNKDEMLQLLRYHINWMSSLHCTTSILYDRLQAFQLCVHAIEKNIAWPPPFEAIQMIKKQGIYVLKEDVFYISNIPKIFNE